MTTLRRVGERTHHLDEEVVGSPDASELSAEDAIRSGPLS
jgi:hypothetical protein